MNRLKRFLLIVGLLGVVAATIGVMPGPDDGLMGDWNFDNDPDGVVLDVSGNGNNGSLVGGAGLQH